MNLTRLQMLAITIGVLTFVGGSVAQLDTLFGAGVEHIIVAALTLLTGGLSVVMTVVSGQGSQFANVKFHGWRFAHHGQREHHAGYCRRRCQ